MAVAATGEVKERGAMSRVMPVVAKVVALCLVALVALLLLLPAPPDLQSAGGETRVAKYVPAIRETTNPLRPDPEEVDPPTLQPIIEPVPAEPTPVIVPQIPAPALSPEVTATPPVAPALPQRKPKAPQVDSAPAITRQEAPPSSAQPVNTANVAPSETPTFVPGTGSDLPSRADIRDWLRSQAWEFLGGVDPQGNILYRFEVWLDAPPNVLKSIASVSYSYDAPSATPANRNIQNSKNKFRARFGSLSCSKKVTVTLTMADGRKQRTVADGCRALN